MGGAGGAQSGQNPIATINHPGDGETRQQSNGPVPLVGVANDPQDGALTGAALVWTSDIDGQLGVGEQLDFTFSLGTHTVTLTATDSDGNTGTDSITLIMQ
jgi:chitinase